MTTKLRDVIDILRHDGISVGWGNSGKGERKCVMHALSMTACAEHLDTIQDQDAIRTIIREQYPEQYPERGLTKYPERGLTTVVSVGAFNDWRAKEGDYEAIFTVLEKAAVLREGEL